MQRSPRIISPQTKLKQVCVIMHRSPRITLPHSIILVGKKIKLYTEPKNIILFFFPTKNTPQKVSCKHAKAHQIAGNCI